MKIAVSDAKAQLTELVRRAEAGEEIILTRHGHSAVRLVPLRSATEPTARRKLIDDVRAAARGRASSGPGAARSQDFLYGEQGLPE